ncbi:MAG: preprotein translocase subunit SecE [Bacteroidia bacterium]|nr:preprotein translocase subunit SecE [Bacteroidia bacterium]
MGVRISPLVLKNKKMDKLKNMWNHSVDELLNKVTWPTWDELRESAIIVLVASLIFAVFVRIIDSALGYGLDFFYNLFR